MSNRRKRPPKEAGPRRSRLGWMLPLAVLVVVGFLYYRPLTSYAQTRSQLADRRAAVVELRSQKARVEARLARAGSLEVLARDARGIGYVAPGEQLFIVKGIPEWRRQHRP